MFEKKTTIFKKKDRETWELIKAALKEDKIRGVHAFHYFADVVAPGGCASYYYYILYGLAFLELPESKDLAFLLQSQAGD